MGKWKQCFDQRKNWERPPSLERKRHSPPLSDTLLSPPKRHHSNTTYPPQYLYQAFPLQRTHVLSHPPLPQPYPQQLRSVYPPGPIVQTFPNALTYPQPYNHMLGRKTTAPPMTRSYSPSLSGIIPLQPLPNAQTVPNVVVAGKSQGCPNGSSSLVAQLQITNVVGNATMSPSPQKPAPTGKSTPPTLLLVPTDCCCSPPVQVSRQPHLCAQNTPTISPCMRAEPSKLMDSPVTRGKMPATEYHQLHRQPSTTDISRLPHTRAAQPDISCLLPPANTQPDISRLLPPPPSRITQTECAHENSDRLPATQHASSSLPTPPSIQDQEDVNLSRLRVKEMLQAVTDMLMTEEEEAAVTDQSKPDTEQEKLVTQQEKPVTDSCKPVTELRVVRGSSQQLSISACETNSLDEDDDDEESQLRIVEEHPPPPTPDPVPTDTRRLHKPLYHVPFAHSPRPRSLGDQLYPIIIDGEYSTARTTETETETGNMCSPDEGYSSGTSPLESAPHDFSSLLPFADYDRRITHSSSSTPERLETSRKEEDSRDSNSEQRNPLGKESRSEDSQMDLNSSADSYYFGDEEIRDEDYEEDFVMDVDVFSPILPVPPTTTEERPMTSKIITRDLITMLRSEDLISMVRSESGEEDLQLIVSIDRSSLSSVPAAVSQPLLRLRRPSQSYTVSLPLTTCLEQPPQRRPRRKRHYLSDPTYRPGMKLVAPSHNNNNNNRTKPQLTTKPRTRLVTKSASEECVSELIVSIPIFRSADGKLLCNEEDAIEDSDESGTLMELLASKLEEKASEERRRVPEIVHLEPHYPGESEDSMDSIASGVCETPEPVTEVAECLTLPSVCSVVDLRNCVQGLSGVCSGSSEKWEGSAEKANQLEVGKEVELKELASDTSDTSSQCSPELTGMELLHLKPQSPTTYDKNSSKKTVFSKVHSAATVYCEELAAAIEEKLGNEKWRVYSLPSHSDPRLRVQRYSLGSKDIFELSSVNGRWQLKALQDNNKSSNATTDRPLLKLIANLTPSILI